jgi:hypothetical protein
MKEEESADDRCGDQKRNQIIHEHSTLKSVVAHGQGQCNMNNRQDGKGVAERTMNHMPEIEDLLGSREKQNALRKGRLLPGNHDSPL